MESNIKQSIFIKLTYNPINKYKTTHNNKETKRHRVNASLITETPETQKQAYWPASGNWV